MNIKLLVLSLILLLIPVSTIAEQDKNTYEIVLEGTSCKERMETKQVDCEYRIGEDLHIGIVGIGLPDTAVTFMRVDIMGDFYASYGISHGCVCVKRGLKNTKRKDFASFLDVAYISTKNGQVYNNLKTCKAGD